MSELAPDSIRALERVEVEACRSWTEAPPAEVARDLGIGLLPLGSALAVRASRVDILMYNRIVGLGAGATPLEGELDEAIGFFRAAGVPRIMVNVSPIVPPEAREWLEARGFYLHNHWLRLWREALAPVDGAPDPRVRPIGREHAEVFARTDVEAFGHPETMIPWVAATVARPGWRQWAAFDGDDPAGFAALFVNGSTGWLGFASTRPSHRRQGIQSALIATRIRAAAGSGCRLLAVETADDTPEKPNPSTHNLVRQGFRIAYRLPNWVLKLG